MSNATGAGRTTFASGSRSRPALTRADRVRQRRQQGERRPAKKPRSAPTGRRPLGRGGLRAGRPWQAVAVPAPRGGLASLGPGAARRPARSARRPGRPSTAALGAWPLIAAIGPWRLASALLAALTLAALYHVLHAPQFFVYDFELAGANFVPAVDIYEAADVDTDQIFWIDAASVQARIAAMSGIKEAAVRVTWPARLQVTVEERAPVVSWQQGGQSQWVDGDGVAFEQRADLPGLLPIQVDAAAAPLEVIPDTPVVPVEAVAGALKLRELRPNIELLHYDSLHGLSYQDGRGWRGYFGVGGDMGMKLKVYETLVANLLNRQILPTVVSVENVDAPYYSR
ncbi:MAG: FtsQ-type POTRA domain-containing protein [Chloroflexi bacterium]|nr:FtsQ-type POTRA domain-containing protein [Chloroflexota bacterium]